jgi:hypothetical protein
VSIEYFKPDGKNGHRFILRDDEPTEDVRGDFCPYLVESIDKLGHEAARMTSLSLSPYRKGRNTELKEPVARYTVLEYGRHSHRNVPSRLQVCTTRYVGAYRTSVGPSSDFAELEIRPRFGNAIFNYLLSFVSEVFVPPEADREVQCTGQDYVYWLMILLWRSSFDRAVSVAHIPRTYVERRENGRRVRGRILLTEQSRKNLIDQSRIYCKYRELTFDNTLNRTVRYVYKLLSRGGGRELLADVAPYDVRLASLGVSDNPVSAEQIQEIVYTPVNMSYSMLMDISAQVIDKVGSSSYEDRGSADGFSFFLDVAELWENYVYRILKKGLPPEFQVVSPNFEGEAYYLLEDRRRQIKLDILIMKNGRILAVLDAKYKRGYTGIGRTEKGLIA